MHLLIRIYPFLAVMLGVAAEHLDINQAVIASPKSQTTQPGVHKVQHELKKAEIFPTVIDKFLPSFLLDVKWPSGERAELGNTVKVDKVQDEPTIKVRRTRSVAAEAATNVTYTITITDPDAPSRDDPKWGEMCHFIASGVKIPSTDPSAVVRLSGLKDVMPYKPPGPPPKTGKHRYVFLLFAPANGTTDPLNLTKPSDRKHWGADEPGHGVRDWAKDNGLEPVAANFVYAQNEEQ